MVGMPNLGLIHREDEQRGCEDNITMFYLAAKTSNDSRPLFWSLGRKPQPFPYTLHKDAAFSAVWLPKISRWLHRK